MLARFPVLALGLLLSACAVTPPPPPAQAALPGNDHWPTYGHDRGGQQGLYPKG